MLLSTVLSSALPNGMPALDVCLTAPLRKSDDVSGKLVAVKVLAACKPARATLVAGQRGDAMCCEEVAVIRSALLSYIMERYPKDALTGRISCRQGRVLGCGRPLRTKCNGSITCDYSKVRHKSMCRESKSD